MLRVDTLAAILLVSFAGYYCGGLVGNISRASQSLGSSGQEVILLPPRTQDDDDITAPASVDAKLAPTIPVELEASVAREIVAGLKGPSEAALVTSSAPAALRVSLPAKLKSYAHDTVEKHEENAPLPPTPPPQPKKVSSVLELEALLRSAAVCDRPSHILPHHLIPFPSFRRAPGSLSAGPAWR